MKAPIALSPEIAARRLWMSTVAGARTSVATAAAAERLGTELRQGLGRWIGEDGYRVVLTRAVGLVVGEHPSIATVSSFGSAQPLPAPGAVALGQGVIALVTTIIELLGRVIGDEMALTLIAHLPAGAAGDKALPDIERGAHG